jgi:methionyl aminopeptidase
MADEEQVGVYGYKLLHDAPLTTSLPLASARRLHKIIRENFGTIVFCRRYLERLGVERYLAGVSTTDFVTLAGRSILTSA